MAFPVTTLLDDFNRANEGPPPSAAWTTGCLGGSAGLKVVSNKCVANASEADGYWNAGVTSSADCEAYGTIDTILFNESLYLYLRLANIGSSTTDGYRVRCQFRITILDTRYFLQRLDNGVATNVKSSDVTAGAADGDSYGAELIGTTLTAYKKPAAGSWAAASSTTDSTYSAAGYIGGGLSSTDAGSTLDDFSGGPFAGGTTYLRNVSEILNIAETTGKAAIWLRLVAETINILETARAALTLSRTVAETLNILETNKAAMALSRVVAEIVNIAEATGSAMSRLLTKIISESVQLLETTKRTLTLTRGLAETVDIGEAVHKAATWLRLVAESVQISEASHRAMTMARTVAETVNISEAAGRLGALVQWIAETLHISEVSNRAWVQAQALVKWANETLHLGDFLSIAKWPFGHLSVTIQRDYQRVQLIGRGYLAAAVGRLYRVRNNQS